MGRFSPTVSQLSGLSGIAGVTRAVGDRRKRKREEELQDEEAKRREKAAELDSTLTELQLDDLGVRRGTAPQVEVENDIFEGERLGMGAGTEDLATNGLAGALQGIEMPQRQAPTGSDELVFVPGAYIRDVGFTEKGLTEQDFLAHTQGLNDPGPRMQQDPNTVQLTDDRFLDRRETPGARQAAAGQRQDMAVLEALAQMGATREEIDLVASDPAFRDEVLSRIEGRDEPEEQGVTEEELRAAGVPERSIAAALRDPALARTLVSSHNRPEGDSPGARGRAEDQRDAYISTLITAGVDDDGEIVAAVERRFPDSPAALDDVRRVRGKPADDDPDVRQDERRKSLEKLVPGGITAFGGGPELEQVYQDLLDGVPIDQIRSEIEAAGINPTAVARIDDYLSFVAPELERLDGGN